MNSFLALGRYSEYGWIERERKKKVQSPLDEVLYFKARVLYKLVIFRTNPGHVRSVHRTQSLSSILSHGTGQPSCDSSWFLTFLGSLGKSLNSYPGCHCRLILPQFLINTWLGALRCWAGSRKSLIRGQVHWTHKAPVHLASKHLHVVFVPFKVYIFRVPLWRKDTKGTLEEQSLPMSHNSQQ